MPHVWANRTVKNNMFTRVLTENGMRHLTVSEVISLLIGSVFWKVRTILSHTPSSDGILGQSAPVLMNKKLKGLGSAKIVLGLSTFWSEQEK